VLADAEMEIAATGTAGLEVARAGEFQRRLVRRTEVRRSAEPPISQGMFWASTFST